ncbi:macrophage mannose receptor 1-like [Hyposmocoma kahamanoa]|uniref:macrophage mannose receptor 1-like n=1 Tax=Hyposmocoma kahamanoa TaxID=1477025 RepID=UPI000E6D8AC4|nr:macrophage mannose receptor 1-like [Hyposmocoma kahamanoa]
MNILQTMQNLIRTSFTTPKSIYTGIHSTFAEGHFFSIDGIPLAHMPVNWAPDEPNNVDGNENCTILHPNGTLADVNCGYVHPFICFKKRTDDMAEMNECGTIDREYQYNNVTGSCYKFHIIARNWQRAFKTCSAEGGYLAIVNSPEEAELFKTMHLENLRRTTTQNVNNRISFLGFRFWQELGAWVTIHGQTLKEAGYDHWAGGEPNNVKNADNLYEGEYCGSIDAGCKKVGLNDFWCKYENPFICEKQPVVVESSSQSSSSTSGPTTVSYIDFSVANTIVPRNYDEY